MKKFLCVSLCIIFLILTGCAAKTEISADDFASKLTEKNFTLNEADDSTVTATNGTYTISYIIMDPESAKTLPYALNQILQTSENNFNVRTLSVKKSGSNYDCMYFNSGDNFFIYSRVGSTVIFCEANKEYRNEILDIFDELGYK